MNVGPILDLPQWISEVQQQIGERRLVCSISGGKDSTCMALLLKEAGLAFESIFLDTGWEHPATLEYLTRYLPQFIGPIKILENEKGKMKDLIRQKQAFPRQRARWCTGELKLAPAKKYIRGMDVEPINVVGIRAEESLRRADYPEWEYSSDFKCDVWRPILHWSEEDVIQMLQRHNVRPNPLYLLGSSRVGCFPCVFASKKSLRILAAESPERVDEIRTLEAELNSGLPEPEHTWFRIGKQKTPIDEVLAWAHRTKSGKELFASTDRDQGCMRWGMCEFEHPVTAQHSINQSIPLK